MGRQPPQQRMWAAALNDESIPIRSYPIPFLKAVTFWIPSRFLSGDRVDIGGCVADLNDKIMRRGFVLSTHQILTTPIDESTVELTFERDDPFEVPELRSWTNSHRDYFGLENPYQMAEDCAGHTYSHIMTSVVEPYLFPGELISGILHGVTDAHYFFCSCHHADVVYTTKHRLVCMACGATHAVLEEPLSFQPKRLITADEWREYFDHLGPRWDEEVGLSLVDFCEVESRRTLWITSQWEEARDEFVFLSRSPREAVAEALRRSGADPSALLEAGFEPIDLPPPPAFQVDDDSISVDLIENSAYALRAGVAAYLGAATDATQHVHALPHLFRAIELLLKARLEQLVPTALGDNPNNPTVLNRLQTAGVVIDPAEFQLVGHLRRLRNSLQHGSASFNYRKGRSLCRGAIVFLSRFSHAELDLWIGDAIPPREWQSLLSIPELSAIAEQVVNTRLQSAREDCTM